MESLQSEKTTADLEMLDLQIIELIISRHRGRIWNYSSANAGLTTFISLPIEKSLKFK